MSEELKPITSADAGFDAEEPNARSIIALTGGAVVLLIAVIIGVTYYFNHVFERQEYEQVLAPPSEQLKQLHAREDWELTHYQLVDKAKGQVRIPLNRAMELLVKEAAEGKLKYPTADQAVKKVETAAQAAPAAQAAVAH